MREQTTIRLPADLMDALRSEADDKGISLNDVITRRLRESCSAGSPHAPARTDQRTD